MTAQSVFIVYKTTEATKQEEIIRDITSHSMLLQSLGLTQIKPPQILKGQNGYYIEIVEWKSEAESKTAHEIPEVAQKWKELGSKYELVSLSQVSETATAFSKFEVINVASERKAVFQDTMIAAKDAKLAEFYQRVFDLDLGEETESYLNLVDSQTKQVLCITKGPSVERCAPCFRVKDLKNSEQELLAGNGKVINRWEHGSWRGINALDPEGNEIMFWQPGGTT